MVSGVKTNNTKNFLLKNNQDKYICRSVWHTSLKVLKLLFTPPSGVETENAKKFCSKVTPTTIFSKVYLAQFSTNWKFTGVFAYYRLLDRSQIIWLTGINWLTLNHDWNFLHRMNGFREHSLRLLVSLKKPRQSHFKLLIRLNLDSLGLPLGIAGGCRWPLDQMVDL